MGIKKQACFTYMPAFTLNTCSSDPAPIYNRGGYFANAHLPMKTGGVACPNGLHAIDTFRQPIPNLLKSIHNHGQAVRV